jgi:phosphomevalonate kinase
LILLGEYAVLEGAPAIVMAIDRRAQVGVRRPAKRNLVTAPEIYERIVSFVVDGQRNVEWIGVDPSTGVRLELLAQVLAKYWPGEPVQIETDTSAFYEDGIKMGFGSSAALTVAASAALAGKKPGLAELVEIHRAAQEGRGSGFDVAASLHGGVIKFRTKPLEAEPVSLPEGLHLRCLWTGHAASTPGFLRGLDGLGRRRSAIDALVDSAETEIGGLDDKAATWVRAVRNFSKALMRFADETSLPIYSGGHAEVARLAEQTGVVYKPSGAGGGDLGVAISDDAAAMKTFREGLRPTSIRVLPIAVDPRGLVLD